MALDELIADLMALPASVGDEGGVLLQDVFCKLSVGHEGVPVLSVSNVDLVDDC